MKGYTDVEQSKKLAEILPIESADMRYLPSGNTHPWVWDEDPKILAVGAAPCWSLAALLEVLPNYEIFNRTKGGEIEVDSSLYALGSEGDETLLDVVVNMIDLLHKEGLI